MRDFDPPPSVRDMNGKFNAFLKGKVARQRDSEAFEKESDEGNDTRQRDSEGLQVEAEEFEEFAQKWGLSEDAMDRLRSLSSDLQATVMLDFDPPPNVRDVNAKFVAFLKGRV